MLPWNGEDDFQSPHEAKLLAGRPPSCIKVQYRSASYKHCVRPYRETISMAIRNRGVWPDCESLLDIWTWLEDSPFGGSSTFLDAGANIGSCTLLMAAVHNASVLSFEPNPANLHFLVRSLKHSANHDLRKRVTLYPAGLGDVALSAPLFVAYKNGGNGQLLNSPTTFKPAEIIGSVKVVTLDSVLSLTDSDAGAQQPHRVRLMKMDVQGFEVRLLAGATGIFTRQQVGCVKFEMQNSLLTQQNTSSRQLYDAFRHYGYVVIETEGYTRAKPPPKNASVHGCGERNVCGNDMDFLACTRAAYQSIVSARERRKPRL